MTCVFSIILSLSLISGSKWQQLSLYNMFPLSRGFSAEFGPELRYGRSASTQSLDSVGSGGLPLAPDLSEQPSAPANQQQSMRKKRAEAFVRESHKCKSRRGSGSGVAAKAESQPEIEPHHVLDPLFSWPLLWLSLLCGRNQENVQEDDEDGASAARTQEARRVRLLDAMMMGITLSTAYSGLDTPVYALHCIMGALQQDGWHIAGDSCVCAQACDISRECREVLCSWQRGPRAEHVFADIEQKVKPTVLKELDRLQQGARGDNVEDQKRIFEDMAALLASDLEAAFARHTAMCEVHGKRCSTEAIGPQGEPKRLRICIAGTPCVAFTRMRGASRTKQAHPTWRGLLTWAAELRHLRPDVIIHENAPEFDPSLLAELLPNYKYISVKFDPADLFGIHRLRRYSCFWAPDLVHFYGTAEEFEYLWHAQRLLTADASLNPCAVPVCDDFFTAPEHVVDVHKESLGTKRFAATDDWRELLSTSAVRHLQLYQEALNDPSAPCVFDVSQNPQMVRRSGSRIPTLMRGSSYWSQQKARLAIPDEHLLMQGLPVPSVLPDRVRVLAPMPFDAEQVSDRVKKSLAGNGMFVPAVGSFMMYVLCNVHPQLAAAVVPACAACILQASWDPLPLENCSGGHEWGRWGKRRARTRSRRGSGAMLH